MTCMILAAGLGTRMRPLTDHTPKPLLEVGGKPLIVWHIERLKEAGFHHIVINVAHLGQQVIDALGDGSSLGVKIDFSDEQNEGPLETAGGIVKALPFLSDTFLVINGDVWTDYKYDIDYQLAEDSLVHLVLIDNPPHNLKGDFLLDGTEERYTFSGIGYYSKTLFQNLQYGKQALAPLLFSTIEEKRLSTEYYNGVWYDIGTPERLAYLDNQLKTKV